MDNTAHQPPPKEWGNEPLTQYLDDSQGNRWATFANKRSAVIDLTTIDAMFRRMFHGAVNPRPMLPVSFFLRAHAAFLAASGAVMAGQTFEAQALLRVCLEQGGYAHYVGGDEARWKRWMERDEARTKTQQAKWRSEFTHGKVKTSIMSADADVGHCFSILYDQTIDFGAHPNVRGMSLNSDIAVTEDDGRKIDTVFLQTDSLKLDFALRTTAQVGICVLRIGRMIYPHRVQETGVLPQLETIMKRF